MKFLYLTAKHYQLIKEKNITTFAPWLLKDACPLEDFFHPSLKYIRYSRGEYHPCFSALAIEKNEMVILILDENDNWIRTIDHTNIQDFINTYQMLK